MPPKQRPLLRAKLLGATKPEHYLLPLNSSKVKFGIGRGRRGYDPTRPMKDWGTAWHTLIDKAGLGKFRFQDLRHTAVTHLLEKGTPLAVVESLVGHLSVKMLRHYTHVTSGAIRKAVDALDDEPILVQKTPISDDDASRNENDSAANGLIQ